MHLATIRRRLSFITNCASLRCTHVQMCVQNNFCFFPVSYCFARAIARLFRKSFTTFAVRPCSDQLCIVNAKKPRSSVVCRRSGVRSHYVRRAPLSFRLAVAVAFVTRNIRRCVHAHDGRRRYDDHPAPDDGMFYAC